MTVTLRLAWRNLWRHKRRTWLTVSAIAFSTTLLVFLETTQFGAYDMFIDNALRVFTGQMQVQREGYLDKPQMRTSIPRAAELARELRRTTGLEAVAVRAQGFALAASGTRSYGVPVVGVEPAYEPGLSTIPKVVTRGRYLARDDANEAVLGAVLARNLKIEVGDELTLLGSGRDGSVAATVVPVVGIFESGNPELDRHLVQIPLRTFQDVFSMGDEAHAIAVAGPSLAELERTEARVAAALPRDRGLVLLDWERLLPGIKQAIQADMVQNWFTYIILIVVVTFSIMNTFLVSVLERTREFGIMLALGATPLRIGGLVLLESVLLTLMGLALGVALGGAIAVYLNRVGFTFPGLKEIHSQFGLPGVIYPKLSFLGFTLGPAVMFVFTAAAALYPAFKIRRLAPVEAIRTA
jgi:ABC-type lipoprotein release transport system permease subunit